MKRECLKIIGTAHVSQNSADEVRESILTDMPDVVAIELDRGRYNRLMEERAGIVRDDTISIGKIIKENKVGVFIVTTVLSYMQNKIGDDLDIKPGSEMISAIEAVEELNNAQEEDEEGNKYICRIALIDRDINITLQRVINNMGFREKLKFAYALLGSFFTSDDEVDEISIEELKSADMIDEMMEEFKDIAPGVYGALVNERDQYLAGSIMNIPEDKVIAVVGAGHREGIVHYLNHPEEMKSRNELLTTEKKGGIPWAKIILALIPVLFVVIFFLAYINGISIEGNLIEFVVISMLMGFLGSILSGSKIQSAIIGGLVAPLTIIHPLLAAGWFSGLAEVRYRKVRQSAIQNLTKAENLRDLWNNNIVRILLVVVGTNIAVSIATLVILPSQVFIPLFMKIFGM